MTVFGSFFIPLFNLSKDDINKYLSPNRKRFVGWLVGFMAYQPL